VSRRFATLLLLAGLLIAFFALDLQHYLKLATIKQSHAHLVQLYRDAPALFIAAFMTIHICALALCLPGAVLTMALAGGSIFGPLLGTPIVLTSLTIGDSLGFLAARFVLGDWVRRAFASHLGKVEEEVERNGAFYLLSLRLMAAVPYFLVNLTFGVTRMRLRVFAPVSFLGLAPATALYANAGTELARINSPGDVLSARLLIIFTLMAAVPVAARYVFGKRLAVGGQA
jgi:uncharacterized membrane protein YdjX (TVP38/TMEM64 family)